MRALLPALLAAAGWGAWRYLRSRKAADLDGETPA